jgi:iron complex transport system ATP-binding protein
MLDLGAAVDRTGVGAIHDPDLAARHDSRVALLADGRRRAVGPPADVLTADRLEAIFGTAVAVDRNPVTGTRAVTALGRDDDP